MNSCGTLSASVPKTRFTVLWKNGLVGPHRGAPRPGPGIASGNSVGSGKRRSSSRMMHLGVAIDVGADLHHRGAPVAARHRHQVRPRHDPRDLAPRSMRSSSGRRSSRIFSENGDCGKWWRMMGCSVAISCSSRGACSTASASRIARHERALAIASVRQAPRNHRRGRTSPNLIQRNVGSAVAGNSERLPPGLAAASERIKQLRRNSCQLHSRLFC